MSQNALILGYGASGQALEALLKTQGYTTWIYDDKSGVNVTQVTLEEIKTLALDKAFISPGISLEHPVSKLMKQKGIPLVGEAEYALSLLPQKKIAITGTNGKTTVTLLCTHILKEAGFEAIACGNVAKDKALASVVLSAPQEAILVVELSSFQIETLSSSARFLTGILLNITPDHLDRYEGINSYAEAKFKLQELCEMFFVYAPVVQQYSQHVKETSIAYIPPKEGFLSGYSFASNIDRENAYAAYLLLEPFNISESVFIKALSHFKKPPHRLEKVAVISGIEFINDSKATNIDATIWALQSFKKPILLLAGGMDKGHPYLEWLPYLSLVKEIICFGQAEEIIYSQLSSHISCIRKQTLASAITYAYDQAKSGEIVLLSPGCSSFDAFKDYAERGSQFCQNVLNLKSKENCL